MISEGPPQELNPYESKIGERQFGPHKSVFYSEKGSACPHPHCEDDVWPRLEDDVTDLMEDLMIRGYGGTPEALFEKAGYLFHGNDAATLALQPTITSRLISKRLTGKYYAQFIGSETPTVATALINAVNAVSSELVDESNRAARQGIRTVLGKIEGMQAAGVCWVIMGKKAYLLRVGNNRGYKISPGNNGAPSVITTYRNTGSEVEIKEQDTPHIGSRSVIDDKYINIDEVDLEHGDILGLDSDGFHNYVDPVNNENNAHHWIRDAFDKHYKPGGLKRVVSHLIQQADELKNYPDGSQHRCNDDITLDLIEVGGIPFSRADEYRKQWKRLRAGDYRDNQQVVMGMVSRYLNELQTATPQLKSGLSTMLRRTSEQTETLEEDATVRSILMQAITSRGLQPNQITSMISSLRNSNYGKIIEAFAQRIFPDLIVAAHNIRLGDDFAAEKAVRLATFMTEVSELIRDKKIAVTNYQTLLIFLQKVYGWPISDTNERASLTIAMEKAIATARQYKELKMQVLDIEQLLRSE